LTLGREERAIDLWRSMKRRGLTAQADLEAWMQRRTAADRQPADPPLP
jgi:hypothetical protein